MYASSSTLKPPKISNYARPASSFAVAVAITPHINSDPRFSLGLFRNVTAASSRTLKCLPLYCRAIVDSNAPTARGLCGSFCALAQHGAAK